MPTRSIGPMIAFEPDETAVADTASSIAAIVNNFRGGYYEPLMRLFAGIEKGLVDPNEALVQGTRGGRLYEQYFGVTPPEPRREVTTQVPYTAQPTMSHEAEVPYDPSAPTERRMLEKKEVRGGFQPQNVSQLQNFIIREMAAGRQIPRELMAASGLIKTRAQEELFDPSLSQELARIKADPRRLKVFVDLQRARPDAPLNDLLNFEKAITGGSVPEDMRTAVGAGLGKSADQQKIEAQMRDRELDRKSREGTMRERLQAYREIWNQRIEAGDRREALRAESRKDVAASRGYVSLMNHLAEDIGIENAAQVAHELIYGEGEIPDSIRPAVERALALRQRYMKARATNLEALPSDRRYAANLREVGLMQNAERLEATLKAMAGRDEHRAFMGYLSRELSSIANMSKDPSRRKEAGDAAARILKEHLGWEVGEPEGALNIFLNGVGKTFGLNLGTPSLQPPKRETAPFNPPRIEGTPPAQTPAITRPKGRESSSPAPSKKEAPTFFTPEAQKFFKDYGITR